MSASHSLQGRLPLWRAALVIARRDFGAILFSRSFIFFLLGPLFMIAVSTLAGGLGAKVEEGTQRSDIGLALSAADNLTMTRAAESLDHFGKLDMPRLRQIAVASPGQALDARALLKSNDVRAVLTGSVAAPVLTGPKRAIEELRGPIGLISAQAQGLGPRGYPQVALTPIEESRATAQRNQVMTAQFGQIILFMLTMLLAGMVLSNLVEEKANKIIEILAAAIPMDAVFFGKLFAMLAVSLVGIVVWTGVAVAAIAASGGMSASFAAPAVGWPAFIGLGVIYFSTAYLLIGSVFLAIGSMATTVRDVQTLSMPATMLQLLVFFISSFAMSKPGSTIELAACLFPFSSPYAMLARAAQDAAVWPHLAAIGWQALWVLLLVRFGAKLFRTRVMKSGPARAKKRRWLARA